MAGCHGLAGLSGLCSDDDQSETGDQRDRAEDGGDGEGVLCLVGDLYRADINIFFLVGEGDSSGGEADDAKKDEKNSNDGGWLHELKTFPRQTGRCNTLSDALIVRTGCMRAILHRLRGIAVGCNLLLHGKGGWSSL
jgi:hypothetical protein